MRTRTAFGSLITGTVLAVLAGSCAHVPTYTIFDPTQRVGDPPWVLCQDIERFSQVTMRVPGGAGGVLTLPRGHTLHIPPNAVRRGDSVDVTFMQLAGPGVAVRLRPRGQRFADSLTLTLSYQGRNCNVSGGNLNIYRVAKDDEPNEIAPRDRTGNEPPSSVRGRLIRFSAYALAR